MKILFAVPRYHPNHDGMVSGLLAAGHEVAFLVGDAHHAEEHRDGVRVTRLAAGRGRLRPILAHLRAARPDVVVGRNTGPTGYATFLACRWLGIRHLLYVQYPGGYEDMDLGRRLRLALGLWPRHTVNSACETPKCQIPGKTFDFLPFAMELGAPKAAYPDLGPVRALTVGKLDQERKNLVPMVRHLAPLMRDGRLVLTIVGLCGPEVSPTYRALLAEIAAQGVADQVQIIENLDYRASRALYPAHDLFVLASSRERAAISPVEAMAAGLAVVCGADNGTNYFIVPGETGYVFPDGDFAAMAERVAQLIGNPAELARMGRAGRRRIAEHFAPADYARRFVEVVERRFGAVPATGSR